MNRTEVVFEFCKIYHRYKCTEKVAGIMSDKTSAEKSIAALEHIAAIAKIDIDKEYKNFINQAAHCN